MSLLSALGVARSALDAQTASLQTVGQNIANAENEDYSRQRVEHVAAFTDDYVRFQIGTGVRIARIERVIDANLEEAIRDAASRLGDLDARDLFLQRLESIFGEISENSLGQELSEFFDAVSDLAMRPDDYGARVTLASRGETLADAIRFVEERVRGVRKDLDGEIRTAVDEVNRLTAEIAQLNEEILAAEGGGIDVGTANDLRDKRDGALRDLAALMDIHAVETSTGVVNVVSQGEFLVFADRAEMLEYETRADDGVIEAQVRFSGSGRALAPASGEVAGLLAGRDEIVPTIEADLDALARAIIGEFNALHGTGTGLEGLSDETSTNAVSSVGTRLDEAGLPFEVRHGSFSLEVRNENTGRVDAYTIAIDLDGIGTQTTLEELSASIAAAVALDHPEIEASLTSDGRLRIRSTSSAVTFSLADDTSGVVAALGLNPFFTGSDARTMAIDARITDDPNRIAAGQGGGAADGANAEAMAALRDRRFLDGGGATIEEYYEGMVGALGVMARDASERAEDQEAIVNHLGAERSAISGVNLDEEAIQLMRYQRAYQAASRFLAVVDGLLETLLSAV
ncbi:MAG: flagellar hook-associated protein FlgK [Planctomycetes bacterium]|nr:flagellar hook-associated protein FlgK [Planctomycetota bacterium]